MILKGDQSEANHLAEPLDDRGGCGGPGFPKPESWAQRTGAHLARLNHMISHVLLGTLQKVGNGRQRIIHFKWCVNCISVTLFLKKDGWLSFRGTAVKGQ